MQLHTWAHLIIGSQLFIFFEEKFKNQKKMLKSLRMCLFLYLPISTRFKPLSKYRFLFFSEFPYILSQLIPSTSPLLTHHCSDRHCYRSIFFSLTANFSFSYIHSDSRMSVLLWQTADHACVWSVFLFFFHSACFRGAFALFCGSARCGRCHL